jgi:hypothetical protein
MFRINDNAEIQRTFFNRALFIISEIVCFIFTLITEFSDIF